jgi:hypothetical protein
MSTVEESGVNKENLRRARQFEARIEEVHNRDEFVCSKESLERSGVF